MCQNAQPVLLGLAAMGILMMLLVIVHITTRGPERYPVSPIWEVHDAEPARAPAAIRDYGCGSCHVIPGVDEARGRVGPELNRLRRQTYIAGRLPNTPEHLVFWIMNPRHVDPGNVMPDLGVTEQDARDIAGYLYEVSRD